MAALTFTASAADLTRITNALCAQYGYRATINGAPNPEGKPEFAKRMMIRDLKQRTQQYERQAAIAAAVATVVPPTDVPIT